jgi:DNA-binding NarL/FixJ family response regulator
MDIHLPGQSQDGIQATRTIKQRWPHVQVMICTVHEDDEKIFNALRAGATGYLLKRSSVEQVIEALGQLLDGGSPMSPGIARRVVCSFAPQPDGEPEAQLTAREQEVLDLLATGRRVKDIAAHLFVSHNTVRTHIRHIYEKLQVQGRMEAVNKVRRRS